MYVRDGQRRHARMDETVPQLGKLLGHGDNGAIHESARKGWVAKVIGTRTADAKRVVQHEYTVQDQLATMGVAPRVRPPVFRGDSAYLEMERIYPIRFDEFIGNYRYQEGLVKLVVRMCSKGFLHNDLHVGNIGYRNDKKTPVIFDFGETIQTEPPTSDDVLAQFVIAQLYCLIDNCNRNNCVPGAAAAQPGPGCFPPSYFEDMCESGPVIDTIYALRGGKYDLLR
jgi:hypothetical protein